MYYLKKSLSNIYNSIKEHKFIFILLIILELFFLFTLVFISVNYHLKILTDAQNIIVPLQNSNIYNVTNVADTQPFIDEMYGIYKNYNSMLSNLKNYVFWLIGIFLVLNSLLWIISSWLLDKYLFNKDITGFCKSKVCNILKLKVFYKMWLKFFASALVLFVPIIVIGYYLLVWLLRTEIGMDSFAQATQVLVYLLIFFYFILISAYAFIGITSWKNFFKSTFIVLSKKIHYTLLVLLINLVLISLSLYLIYLSTNSQIFS